MAGSGWGFIGVEGGKSLLQVSAASGFSFLCLAVPVDPGEWAFLTGSQGTGLGIVSQKLKVQGGCFSCEGKSKLCLWFSGVDFG